MKDDEHYHYVSHYGDDETSVNEDSCCGVLVLGWKDNEHHNSTHFEGHSYIKQVWRPLEWGLSQTIQQFHTQAGG